MVEGLGAAGSCRLASLRRRMFDWLRWIVGTGLIFAEWRVYTTPLLRHSTPLAVLWYLAVGVLGLPFLLLWGLVRSQPVPAPRPRHRHGLTWRVALSWKPRRCCGCARPHPDPPPPG